MWQRQRDQCLLMVVPPHRDFRVRRMVVQRALQWLKRNNKYYRNIDIDVSVLSQLPDDGDLTDKCGVGIEDTAEKQEAYCWNLSSSQS